MSGRAPWWRGATVYQVYVRSFADSNGDGVGDFPGLISKLDYVAALGVDAIWLSPTHPSPNRDWGYDVSDYDIVNPEYGTEADFDRLLKEAHARGLRIMTDEVLAHTSDEHAWFVESLKGGEKADWYVWAPAREDGTPPNNWLSAFGGPAWSYHPARRASYHHKFLRQQPKLNWRADGARAAALAVLDSWLKRGVDGFRLDVANAFLHDTALRDNPAVPQSARDASYWSRAANMQLHRRDSNLEDNLQVLNEIRMRVERYPDRFVMGEFSEDPERCGAFASPSEGLHSGYSFPLLHADKLGPEFIRDHYRTLARFPAHWPSIAFSNHDVIRTVTRFGGEKAPPALARLLLALLVALRGTLLLYQGEELGLPEASLRRDQIRDPIGDLYYPLYRGRDGCRTPMPWDAAAPNLGFTTGSPWLPLAPEHRELAPSLQERDPQSTLSCARRLLAARRESDALRLGGIEFLDAPAPVLAFLRTCANDRVLCAFNMSADDVSFQSDLLRHAVPLPICTDESRIEGDVLAMNPYAAFFAHV
ncbi:MAG TPA: alpha-amylase family glycosyl hydrolase [Rhizomicrobium sp.]|nr:alpha-amylase family glycosyl hydrolase [Rhizomicrobium sp.]